LINLKNVGSTFGLGGAIAPIAPPRLRAWTEVQGDKTIYFLINRSFRSGQHGRADCSTPYRGSRFKRIQMYGTELHKVSGPIQIKLKS